MTTPGLAVARRQPLGVRSAVPQRPTTPRPLLRDRHRRRRDRRTPNGHGCWLRDVATDLLSRAVVPVHLFVSVRGPSSGCGIRECPGVREAETAGVTGVGKHDVDLTRSGPWGPPAYARSSIRSVTWPRPRSCSPASPARAHGRQPLLRRLRPRRAADRARPERPRLPEHDRHHRAPMPGARSHGVGVRRRGELGVERPGDQLHHRRLRVEVLLGCGAAGVLGSVHQVDLEVEKPEPVQYPPR